jgi:hypothetical protein
MPYKAGQRIRITFSGTIETVNDQLYGTCTVREENGCVHYLFLNDPTARERLLGSAARRVTAGSSVSVSFRAVIPASSTIGAGPDETTTIRDGSFTHFAYLDSPSVTPVTAGAAPELTPPQQELLDALTGKAVPEEASEEIMDEKAVPEETGEEVMEEKAEADDPFHAVTITALPEAPKAPEPAPATPAGSRFAPGQEIRVEFEATIETDIGNTLGTSRAREADGTTHYLFLNSNAAQMLILTDKSPRGRAGDTIKVAFTTKITPPDSFSDKVAPEGTTPVAGPGNRYTHFLDLSSPSITALPAEVTSSRVITRLAELEARQRTLIPQYALTRNRDAAKVCVAGSRKEAEDYVDREDLNPGRFTVRELPAELAPADATELARLTELASSGRLIFGNRWATGVTLRPASFYDENWARKRIAEGLGLELSDLGALDGFTDWAKGAATLLARNYRSVSYLGQRWYGLA